MSKDKAMVKSGGELIASSAFEEVAERLHALSTKLDIKPFNRMFVLAEAINELRTALTDEIMQPIMELQGSRIGFKTDKDTIKNKDTNWKPIKGPGYPVEIVRDVTIEAILFGAYMTGNEVNIISSQMYATKEHFVRKVRELDGLTDLDVTIGTPAIADSVAKVRCKARWKMHGKEQSVGMDDAFPLVFSTRVFDREGGQSVASDMAIGKITRKLYKLIYETATGSKIMIPDGDAEEQARDVDAKVVDRATVDLDDFRPGDPATHTAVDEPIQPAPSRINQAKTQDKAPDATGDYKKAHRELNRIAVTREAEVNERLMAAGIGTLDSIPSDATNPTVMNEVIRIAAEMKE